MLAFRPARASPRLQWTVMQTNAMSAGLFGLGQGEHVERLSALWNLDVGKNRRRHVARTAAAETRHDADVLTTVDLEAHRESLGRRAEPRLPQDLAGLHVVRAHVAIDVADEQQTARRRQHAGQVGRALL